MVKLPIEQRIKGYGRMILEHINGKGFFRKNLPQVFQTKDLPDQQGLLEKNLQLLSPVAIPVNIKHHREVQHTLD